MAKDMKKHITILCGGRSCEHNISLLSAHNVIQALDQNQYHLTIIYISNTSQWYLVPLESWLSSPPALARDIDLGELHKIMLNTDPLRPWYDQHAAQTLPCHVVIPMFHGQFGEDGAIQGLLEMLNIPYVGTGILSSAICMDKSITKALLDAYNITNAPYLVATKQLPMDYTQVSTILGNPVFVKPANSGSSIGVTKVSNEEEYTQALKTAFCYDHKVIIEQAISGRELECAILGNDHPEITLPGEILCKDSFYSFRAKYLDDHAATVVFPALLHNDITENIQSIALKAYRVLGCQGLARVDLFLSDDNEIYVNEINTMPGFTDISLYPRAFSHAGLTTCALLDQLIELALDQHDKREQLHYNADKNRAS